MKSSIAEVSDDSVFFFSDSEEKKKVGNSVTILFKKAVSKMYKFK